MASVVREICVSVRGLHAFNAKNITGRPSQVKVVETIIDEEGHKRKKSSVFESMSGLFRKRSTNEVVENTK